MTEAVRVPACIVGAGRVPASQAAAPPSYSTLTGAELPLAKILASTCSGSLQLCPTLSDLMDGSLPGSSVHGIFQARVLEWGAIALLEQYHSKVVSLLSFVVFHL